MSVHPIVGDMNFDHLIKVIFARFLQICGGELFVSHWLQQMERNGGGQNGGLDSIWMKGDGGPV